MLEMLARLCRVELSMVFAQEMFVGEFAKHEQSVSSSQPAQKIGCLKTYYWVTTILEITAKPA